MWTGKIKATGESMIEPIASHADSCDELGPGPTTGTTLPPTILAADEILFPDEL